MGLWILRCGDNENVPGTSKLIEKRPSSSASLDGHPAQKGLLILDPAPTEDPDDPLNWPLWQRDAALVILCFATFLTTSSGSILGTAFVALSEELQRGYADIANLTAYWQLAVGLAGVVVVPFASIWGKRHQYLLGLVLVLVGCIWTSQSTSFVSFLWSRITQGIGTACFEALLGVSVGDLYHVHQRGVRLAWVTIMGFAAGFMSPVLSGLVLDHLGWRWIFSIIAIFTGVILIAVFLFVPETAYARKAQLQNGDRAEDPQRTIPMAYNGPSEYASPARMGFLMRLLPIQNKISDQNFALLLLRPLIFTFHPAVLWFTLFSGTSISWVIFTVVIMGIKFPEPPLSFTPTQIGLMNFAAWVGSLIGFLICALSSDSSAKWLARRNNSVYEPEFRLVLAVPCCIIGFVGLYGFGVAVADLDKYGWFWPAFFYALQIVSMVMATMIGSAYIVDGYGQIAVEAFIMFMVLKNLFGFGLASASVDWIEATGTLRIFTIIAFVQLGIGLTSLPLYIFGKRIRSIFSKISIFSP
ncbi:MFS transporter [Bisporella sp. PMI_857]|nr:MFS transporter [Bisporella sp. PMI_857]